jgi:hypothetical protein
MNYITVSSSKSEESDDNKRLSASINKLRIEANIGIASYYNTLDFMNTYQNNKNKPLTIYEILIFMTTNIHQDAEIYETIYEDYPTTNVLLKKSNCILKTDDIYWFDEYDNVKWENIIGIDFDDADGWKFYRLQKVIKTHDSNIIELNLINTLNEDNTICYANPSETNVTKITLDKINKYKYKIVVLGIDCRILKHDANSYSLTCDDKNCNIRDVFHGTAYSMNENTEYAPYNYYGNWFTLGINELSDDDEKNFGGESIAYMGDQSQQTISSQYLYHYKLKTNIDLLYFPENNHMDYLLAHMMFFDTCCSSIKEFETNGRTFLDIRRDNNGNIIPASQKEISSVIFKDNFTIRSGQTKMIEKYNYTLTKNLLNIHENPPNFTTSNWAVIKSELMDDGDKGLAGVVCNAYNNFKKTGTKVRHNSLIIHGWCVKNIMYLMSCDPKEILENTGIYIFLPRASPANKSSELNFNETFDKLFTEVLTTIPGIRRTIVSGLAALYVPSTQYDEYKKMITQLITNNNKYKTISKDIYDFIMSNNYTDINKIVQAYNFIDQINKASDRSEYVSQLNKMDPKILQIGGINKYSSVKRLYVLNKHNYEKLNT